MDQSPGPNIARATPVVANISQSGLLPGSMSIFQTSVRAAETPAMGVHKPAINRIPAPIKRMAGIVTLIGVGSLDSAKLALTARGARNHPHQEQPSAGPTASEC